MFMQRLAYSGHASIYMALAAFLIFQPKPDQEIIRNTLAKAVKHKYDGAKFLEIMLEV